MGYVLYGTFCPKKKRPQWDNVTSEVIYMKLKMNYQYTYFIHPFVIKENKYQKYLLSFIKVKI